MITITSRERPNELLVQVEELSGQSIFACYQCGTCTAGCPMVHEMDIYPDKVLRYLMFGMVDKLLQSNSIWACVSCFMCAERCPRDIDIAKVMEALRQIKLRQNVDRTVIADIPQADMEGIPQIALVSHFRKNVA